MNRLFWQKIRVFTTQALLILSALPALAATPTSGTLATSTTLAEKPTTSSMPRGASLSYTYDDLKIESFNFHRADDNKSGTLNFRVNRAVDVTSLTQILSFSPTVSGVTVPTRGLQYNFSVQGNFQTNTNYTMTIAAGLPNKYGKELAADFKYAFSTTPIIQNFNLYNTRVVSEGKQDATVHFDTDPRLDIADLKEHLTFEPAVENFKIERASSGGSYIVRGAFQQKMNYKLKISAGVKSTGGDQLISDETASFKTPVVRPWFDFDKEGKVYFPRQGEVKLNLESRNIKEAKLTLHKLFPSNITLALSYLSQKRGSQSHYYSEGEGEGDGEGEGEAEYETPPDTGSRWQFIGLSEKIGEKEIAIPQSKDQLVKTPLNLQELLPKDKFGVFCIEANTSNVGSQIKIVLNTNIGLIAHWRNEELILFAHDLTTLEPISGGKVSVYSSKHQLLGTTITGSNGIAHLEGFKTQLGVPRVAVLENPKDYTFVELTPRPEDNKAIESDGPAYDKDGYDAFIYADRNLYRPGEPVHLRWMVRKTSGDAVPDMPLKIEILKPNQKKLVSEATTLSKLGSGGLDITTLKSYPTGTYRVNLIVPGEEKKFIGSYTFQLEDFVPAKIESKVAVKDPCWVGGNTYDIEVMGRQLFGAPATQRRASATVSYTRGSFKPAAWKGYTFNNDSEVRIDSSSCGEQTTDEKGVANFHYACNLPKNATFPLKATVNGRVYEISGRAVGANADVMVFPTSLTLGVALTPQADSKKIDASIAAILPDEKPAALKTVKVSIERQTWGYYVRRFYTNNEPNWSYNWETIETRDVALQDGKGATAFDVPEWGYYRVRVHSPETVQYSSLTFYCYYGKCQVEDASRPSLVKITTDKPSYKIGDTAEVRIESPYDGKAFVVLQGNALEQLDPVKIEKNVGIAKFKIKPQHFPNLWLEATAVHSVSLEPMQASPFSSFSAAPIRVEAPERKLKLSFPNLQKEIRPDAKQTIEVEVLDSNGKPVSEAELTLAAVDEGIHLWTGYKTPNPYEWLTRLRRPDLKRNHYYDKVAYESKKADIGGDQMAKRVGKGEDNWIKPVALWSGPVKTDKNGRVKIQLDVPEYNGELRLVAVALNSQAMGSCDSALPVRRPYMLQTGQPRFLLPNDTFQSRTVFFNTTDAPCKVRIAWTTNGALKKISGEKELEVAAKKEADFSTEFAASDGIGAGEILWTATVLSADGKEIDKLTQKIALPVNIPAGFESKSELVTLKPGESRGFAREGFLENDLSEVKLSVGPDALLRLQKVFKYAIGYPYGCVEQTTSKLFPLYILRHAKPFLDVSYQDGQAMNVMINAGIERLFSMQTGSGGLAYWPGGNEPNEYGSIYALHCLTIIKNDREFKIPEDNFKALQAFVRKIVTTWDKEGDHYLYDRAYATYVLALGGDIDGIQQIARFDAIELPRSARMLLAAALAKSTGDVARVQKYLKEKPVKDDSYYRYSNSDFYSALKNSAVELMALQQAGGDLERRNDLVKNILATLEQRYYYSTHESAFAIVALNDYLKEVTKNADKASFEVVGADKQKTTFGPTQMFKGQIQGKVGEFRVNNTGQSELFVNVIRSGIPEKADTSSYRRTIGITRNIENVTSNTFHQTQSYIVRLTIDSERAVDNVILADLLPAGFEIENPRLLSNASNDTPAVKNALRPSYLEMRDDRLIAAFDNLPQGTHTFSYVVRAVTPGTYQYPSATIECMYDGEVKGRTAASAIQVK